VAAATVGLMSGLAYAWWPSGQYRPVRPSDRGTLGSLVGALASPAPAATPPVTFHGKLLGYAMVPRGGATPAHPALLVVPGGAGHPPVVVVLQATRSGGPSTGVSLPFQLPADTPKPGDTEALAVNGTDGGVVYDVSYALIEVTGGAPVTNHNSAYAIASCVACRTVAVSFQVVLVIGQSDVVAPVNAAAAVNYKCPACVTTALAQQLVVTLSKHPSAKLLRQLKAALRKLDRIAAHAADLTAAQVVAQVDAVEREIKRDLRRSGLLAQPLPSDSPTPAPGAASVAPTDTPSPSATAISTTSPSSSATPTASTSASPTPSSSASP
jgi:putative peptide zinc metalloprotease protein